MKVRILPRKLRDVEENQRRVVVEAVENNKQVYWANSPHDIAWPYEDVVREFIRPSAGVAGVQAELDAYDAEQNA